MSDPYDSLRPICIAFGTIAGGALFFVGAAAFFRFDGQSLPAVLLIALPGLPVGASLGWLTYKLLKGRS